MQTYIRHLEKHNILTILQHGFRMGNTPQWFMLTLEVHKEQSLEHYFFLLHINSLPKSVLSHVGLLTDNCLLHKAIKSVQDQMNFQKDLDELQILSD